MAGRDLEKGFLSAVVYLHNNGSGAVDFLKMLYQELDAHFSQFELIAVDDSCTDDTIILLREWAAGIQKPLTILHLGSQQGIEAAMNAGIDASIGDYIIEFDAVDYAFDRALIFKAYETVVAGNDIVIVSPAKPKNRLFYRVFNKNSASPYPIREELFHVVTRRAVNRVHSINEFLPHRKAAYAASGLRIATLSAGDIKVHGEPFSLSVDSLLLYTQAGYRISTGITVVMFLLMLLEILYTLVIFLLGIPIVGWTTLMLVFTGGFAGLFLILTIVIKYLSLLIDISFKQQKYLVEGIEKIQK